MSKPPLEDKPPLVTKVFCIHVQDYLLSPMCPLESGACYWQHRDAPRCMYDPEFAKSDFTPEEFSARVGISAPDPQVVNKLKERLISRVKKALAE